MKATFKKLSLLSTCFLAFSLISYNGLPVAEAGSNAPQATATKGKYSGYSQSLENRFLTKCKGDAIKNGLSQQDANKLCLCILKGASAQGITSGQLEAVINNPNAEVSDRFGEVVAACI